MALHNRINKVELKKRIRLQTEDRYVISFYQYAHVKDPVSIRHVMYRKFKQLNVLGRIYIAHEGINAQLSIPKQYVNVLPQKLEEVYPSFNNIKLNIAIENCHYAFALLTIKVRKKIVEDGIEASMFDPSCKGSYILPEDVESVYNNPNAIIVDMRNHYEYEVGHFENAVSIPSNTFREQIPMAIEKLLLYKKKKIVLYCTGGIRCEKASAWMKYNKFEKVYHLQGGIISYAQFIKSNKHLKNRFIGKNFVFDERLGERISDDVISSCHQCGAACDTHTNCKNEGCHLLFIQCDRCRQMYEGCCSTDCQKITKQAPEVRKQNRRGKLNGQNIFNKSTQVLSRRFTHYKKPL